MKESSVSVKLPGLVAVHLDGVTLRILALREIQGGWWPTLTKGEVVQLALRALERELELEEHKAAGLAPPAPVELAGKPKRPGEWSGRKDAKGFTHLDQEPFPGGLGAPARDIAAVRRAQKELEKKPKRAKGRR